MNGFFLTTCVSVVNNPHRTFLVAAPAALGNRLVSRILPTAHIRKTLKAMYLRPSPSQPRGAPTARHRERAQQIAAGIRLCPEQPTPALAT